MNKTAIKNFAVSARRKLIEEITYKAYESGITKGKILDIETFAGGFKVKGRENGKIFKGYELKQREKLVELIKNKGFEQVIEEVAYTWFNRFIALRFMEINDYLPTGVRVLSSVEEGKTEPDIIKEALNIDLEVDQEIIFRLQDSNDTEDLYKYLLIRQCNQLGKIMPAVFEEIADYTELLLPDKLLAEGSVIRDLVDEIEEYDWKIELDEEEQELEEEKGEHGIEIIGWLYQYYISEKKDEVFAGLRKNKKITKENIPAATQLFTPKWIVMYMVENSLGRLWLESHPNEELKAQWKYYLEEVEQEPEVQKQLDELKNPNLNPEEIKVLDPAMGSGHILVYAFDVLYEIYLSAGYSEREIPTLILERNLYGLDIDDRAGQLASFALLMKARSKNRRIFRNRPNLNLCAIQESNSVVDSGEWSVGSSGAVDSRESAVDSKGLVEYFVLGDQDKEKVKLKADIEYLLDVFYDAKEYGSILDVKEIDFDALENRIKEIKNVGQTDIFGRLYKKVLSEKVLPLIKQGRIMSQKYDVVCTNPPYMGRSGMNPNLKKMLDSQFKIYNKDLFSVFMKRNFQYAKTHRYISMITMESWMFLSSYEALRKEIIDNLTITSLVHMPYGGKGRTSLGINFGTCAFVLRQNTLLDYLGNYCYIRYFEINEVGVPLSFPVVNERLGTSKMKDFDRIPGNTFAYWISDRVYEIFSVSKLLGEIASPRQGLATADNNRFLRRWFEVSYKRIKFGARDREEALQSGLKWFPYNKGGEYRKWYGNNEYIINWGQDGLELRSYRPAVIRNPSYYFRESITWSFVSSAYFGVRYSLSGFIFDVGGSSVFPEQENILYLMGFLCSKLATVFMTVLNPTLNFQVGNVASLPIVSPDESIKKAIDNKVKDSINISRTDWDSSETSWDFPKHPLLTHKNNATNIEQAFEQWSIFTENQFNQLKANEEELNRIFIEIYGLQDELTPEVEDKDITISKADRERDIKSFISYAVGCMFGRYSLDADGLIYAGGEWTDKWQGGKVHKIGKDEDGTVLSDQWVIASYFPDEDNILPILDDEYFDDDIVAKFIKFLKVAFGEDALEENIDFIAEALGRNISETSRQAIRRYFLKGFFKDHVRIYKKRPIYWLFDSGRQNGFKALIYMHRYNPLTVARVRTDYLHRLQKKYEAEIDHLNIIIESDISKREQAAARKRKEVVLKKIGECGTYDQTIAHVANQRVEIDLDDGVKVNYAKLISTL